MTADDRSALARPSAACLALVDAQAAPHRVSDLLRDAGARD